MKLNWGHGIAIFFTLFVIVMVSMVITASRQKIELQTEDYYKEELEFGQRIEDRENAMNMGFSFTNNIVDDELIFTFPKPFIAGEFSGTVEFYRPSDETLDVSFPLALDSTGAMVMNALQFRKGHYLLKISYTDGELNYYHEEDFIF